jgi:hypothetical protein
MNNPRVAIFRWMIALPIAGFAVLADSREPPSAAAGGQHRPAQVQANADSGARIYIDPATGRTRQATHAERDEEARQSAEAASLREGRGVRYRQRADGAIRALDLEGRLMESVVVTANADGSLSYSHVAGDASQARPPPAAELEEK